MHELWMHERINTRTKMQLTPEQQKAIEEQKANCPFCKIIKGEIPSKKIYEDDTILVILDINPAAKGHMLVLPKEHYPIMPLIPKDTFKNLFYITKRMCGLCESALIADGSNVFIANGGAAGQQSQHFMLHVIPREKGDGLDNFNLPANELDEEQYDKAAEDLGNNLKIMAGKQFGKAPQGGMQVQGGAPKEYTEEQVLGIIEANPPLLELILKQPEEFIKQAPTHPQLSVIFKGKDLKGIVDKVREKHAAKQESAEPEDDTGEKEDAKEQETEETGKKTVSEEEGVEDMAEEEPGEMSGNKEPEDTGSEGSDTGKEDGETEEKEEADLDDIAGLFN